MYHRFRRLKTSSTFFGHGLQSMKKRKKKKEEERRRRNLDKNSVLSLSAWRGEDALLGWWSNGQNILVRTESSAVSFSLLSGGLRSKWESNTFLDITRMDFGEATDNKYHAGVSQDSSQNQWQDHPGHWEKLIFSSCQFLLESAISLSFCHMP